MQSFPALGLSTALALGTALLLNPDLIGGAGNSLADWENGPKSRADGACRSKWVNSARNDMALQSYLETDVVRLCAPEERHHLAWLLRQYEAHEDAYEQALLGYIARFQGQAMVELATGDDPVTAYDQAAVKAARPLMNDEFKKAVEIRTLPDSEVTALFGKIVRKGLLIRDDLAASIPTAVERAFKRGEGEASPILHPCRVGA